MVFHSPSSSPRKQSGSRQGRKTPVQTKNDQTTPMSSKREANQKGRDHSEKLPQDLSGLNDYTLGDCLGKGAFGSVYRALNWGTGETVAIKQIKLADLPQSELRVIMLEIDLLKNLNHPNIVKYHGFKKTSDSLYIILEYCENGSLHTICKNFGKFPENLLALYMSQVLHGLLYLHEQGVIHRDIKGANILTTKDGLVKLADFGVATKASGLNESSVVGTPYWMAPEVIELSGATTASDIWSLGCTVIELLDGKPPYHKLQPMPALFRIVNDDHPPLPEGASPVVRDFLMQCFQKDPNLRVSAKKLLKHPWILSAKRPNSILLTKPYEEAVKSVKQWNETLKSPNNGSVRQGARQASKSPTPVRKSSAMQQKSQLPTKIPLTANVSRPDPEAYRSPDAETSDNWDDDFATCISPNALKLPHLKPRDNFAGMLTAEKLKAQTNNERIVEGLQTEEYCENESTLKSPVQLMSSDPLKTLRPLQPTKANIALPKKPNLQNSQRRSTAKPEVLRDVANVPAKKSMLGHLSRPSVFRENSVEDYSDLVAPDDHAFQKKIQYLKTQNAESFSPKLFHPSDLKNAPRSTRPPKSSGSFKAFPSPEQYRFAALKRTDSSAEIQKYAEDINDEDFSDIFGKDDTILKRIDSDSDSEHSAHIMLNSKLSASWFGEEDDEDDPFAQFEEGFDEIDLESNAARDRYARLCTVVKSMIGSLKTTQADDVLAEVSDELMQILLESPDVKSVIISSHGMLPILEILEMCQRRDIILRLLKIVNEIIFENIEIQENLCFVGGIPIVSKFAHKKYSKEIRLEAAAFVRQMYQSSTLTLQMFISCGGLNVLVDFLEEDLETERDLVLIGVNGVWSVFELQGPTPKNDFCRIFSRSSVLYPLSLVLNRVLDEAGELAGLIQGRIVNIFLLFSLAENHVKEIVADRMVLKRVLKDLWRMAPTHQVTMLKFIKNLSMLATTHDSLQNSNAIEVLTDLLSSSMKLPHFREVSNQALNIIYNLCRLSKTRQEDAALNGVIPLLQHIVQTEWPLKEFALPILCDMAHSGKVGRKILWQNKGLQFYISLLADRYWQVTALDAIFIWLQEETAKVEEFLLEGSFSDAIVECFINPEISTDSFENLLEPLQKLLRLSPPVAASLAQPDFFSRTAQKLSTKKPVVRLNLLRIIRSICDASEEQGKLIRIYGLYSSVLNLAEHDQAILVREMASELVKSSESDLRRSIDGGKYQSTRRASSSSITPPQLKSTYSLPPTPQHYRATQATGYLEGALEPSHSRSSRPPGLSLRPVSRDGTLSGSSSSGWWGNGSVGKSRLPRTRLGRNSIAEDKEEKTTPMNPSTPTTATASPRTGYVLNGRRRKQTTASSENSKST